VPQIEGMARSYQQQLDDCDAAIAAIETGAQAYTARGRSAQRGQLADLQRERARLGRIVENAAAGGMFTSVVTRRA
jgi:hypothetical protein